MYVHCSTVYNSKDLEWTQTPMDDRLDWEYVAYIHRGILCNHKNDEFMSFVGTWMNLETIIFSKLTQEQKIKHHIFSLIGGYLTMRTHGHRGGSITHWGLLGGLGEWQQGVGSWRGITWGEMPDTGDRDGGTNHVAMYVPMQQSCMFCTCTPELEIKVKKNSLFQCQYRKQW